MLTLITLAFMAVPQEVNEARDRVDLIEVSHTYCEQGKPMYTQVLFYDWRPQQADYQLRSCLLVKNDSHYPIRNFARGDWVVCYVDSGLLREVRADSFRESWMQCDLDLYEQNFVSKADRLGLLFENDQECRSCPPAPLY